MHRRLPLATTLSAATLVLAGCAGSQLTPNSAPPPSEAAAVTVPTLPTGGRVGSGASAEVPTLTAALAQGTVGSPFDALLDAADRTALAASTLEALTTGRTVNWTSDHSDAAGVLRAVNQSTRQQDATLQRSPEVAEVTDLFLIDLPYMVSKSANLRARPDVQSTKLGGFRSGQTLTALGRTSNNWIAVGRQGVVVGYVHAPLVRPVTGGHESRDTDLDGMTPAMIKQQGFNVAVVTPEAPVLDDVRLETTCRTLHYAVRTADHQQHRYTVPACQAADGGWYQAPPATAASTTP